MNSNRYTWLFLIGGLLVALIAAGVWLWKDQFQQSALLDELAEEADFEGWQWLGHYQPIPLKPMGLYETRSGVSLDAVLQDQIASLDNIQAEIEALSGQTDSASRFAQALLQHQQDEQSAGRAFVQYRFPLDPFEGIQLSFPLHLLAEHRITNKLEAESYLDRIEVFAKELSALTPWMERQEKNGLLPPAFLLERSILQLEGMIATPPRKHPLYLNLARRLVRVDPTELNELDATEYLIRMEKLVQEALHPAWETLLARLEDWRTNNTQTGSAYAYPNGEAYYAASLQHQTGPGMEPALVSKLAEKEVDKLSTQLHQLLDSLGATGTDLEQKLQNIALQHGWDTSSTESLEAFRAGFEDMKQLTAGVFPLGEVANTRLVLEPMSAFLQEADFPTQSYAPRVSSENRPYCLVNPQTWPAWYASTQAALQLVPGGYLPASRSYQPGFRAGMSQPAWEAGWPWYALNLLETEVPILPSRPKTYVSFLHIKLVKAAAAKADVAVHTQKWSRETGIAYLRTTAGLSETKATTEIDRIFSQPAAACAPLVGWLKLIEVRTNFQQQFPAKLSLLAWHEWLLKLGPTPLLLLENQLDVLAEIILAS